MKKLITNFRIFFWSRSKWTRVLLSVPMFIISIILLTLLTPIELIKEIPETYRRVADDDYAEDWLEYCWGRKIEL